MPLRPDVEDAVRRIAVDAYMRHAPAHYAIDLLNGVVAHLERSCRHVNLDPTQTRQLLDAFLSNVLHDIADGAAEDLEHEQAMVKAMRLNPKQGLPPLGREKRPPGYVQADYWRRAYDKDYPAGNEIG